MRILYIYNINQVAETYANRLALDGHVVKVFEPNLAGGSASRAIKLAMMPGRILDLRRVLGDLNKDHFDLVHIHWASYGILGLISPIPFIIECHGSDVRYRTREPFFHAVLTPIFQKAKAVLCITPDLLSPVQSIRSDTLFFPGPVDTDRFAPLENEQTKPWTVLLFTRLDPIKGPDIAATGIARFAARHPDVRVLLLDWGQLKEEYKVRYGKRFEFLPIVPPREVPQLILSADVVVGQCKLGILSFCELQAMSCGKPVICPFDYEDAYPIPPPICQAHTAEQIDEHLEYLFQNPAMAKERGKQSRNWILSNHSLSKLVPNLENIYKSLLGKN